MEQKSNFWKSAMIYGLYLGIAFTLYSVILYVTGQTQNKTLGYISIPLYAVGIVLAQINYRNKENNGVIEYGHLVGFGAAIMFFAGFILALYNLILFKIDPSLVEQIKAIQEEALLKNGMSEEQVEASMAIASKMLTPGWMSMMVLISSAFTGVFISMISSIFIKKKPNEDEFDQAMEDVKTE